MRKETNDRNWSEMSFHKYHLNGRKHWYEKEQELYDVDIFSYGLLEDVNLYNCYGVEDWNDIVEEYN